VTGQAAQSGAGTFKLERVPGEEDRGACVGVPYLVMDNSSTSLPLVDVEVGTAEDLCEEVFGQRVAILSSTSFPFAGMMQVVAINGTRSYVYSSGGKLELPLVYCGACALLQECRTRNGSVAEECDTLESALAIPATVVNEPSTTSSPSTVDGVGVSAPAVDGQEQTWCSPSLIVLEKGSSRAAPGLVLAPTSDQLLFSSSDYEDSVRGSGAFFDQVCAEHFLPLLSVQVASLGYAMKNGNVSKAVNLSCVVDGACSDAEWEQGSNSTATVAIQCGCASSHLDSVVLNNTHLRHPNMQRVYSPNDFAFNHFGAGGALLTSWGQILAVNARHLGDTTRGKGAVYFHELNETTSTYELPYVLVHIFSFDNLRFGSGGVGIREDLSSVIIGVPGGFSGGSMVLQTKASWGSGYFFYSFFDGGMGSSNGDELGLGGASVSADGAFAVLAAPFSDLEEGRNGGALVVYKKRETSDNFDFYGRYYADDGQEGDALGLDGLSIDATGRVVIGGAHMHNASNTAQAGSIVVFMLNQTSEEFEYRHRLAPSTLVEGDGLGRYTPALSGDGTVIIGTTYLTGKAYVWKWNASGEVYDLTQTLLPLPGFAGFASLFLCGSNLVIGSPESLSGRGAIIRYHLDIAGGVATVETIMLDASPLSNGAVGRAQPSITCDGKFTAAATPYVSRGDVEELGAVVVWV